MVWHQSSSYSGVPVAAAPLSRECKQALADWFPRHQWDFWLTATYEAPIGSDATAAHRKAWLRFAAERVFQSHLRVVYCQERTKAGLVHYHVLVAALDAPSPSVKAVELTLAWKWKQLDWRAGNIRVARYNALRRAAGYLTKELKEDWDVGTVCCRASRCRRHGCVYRATNL